MFAYDLWDHKKETHSPSVFANDTPEILTFVFLQELMKKLNGIQVICQVFCVLGGVNNLISELVLKSWFIHPQRKVKLTLGFHAEYIMCGLCMHLNKIFCSIFFSIF